LDAAEEFLGLRSETSGANGGEQAMAFAAKILSTGNFLAKMGFLHQKLPALEAARGVLRLMKARRKQPPAGGSRRPLPTISIPHAIALNWEGMRRNPPTGFSVASTDQAQQITVAPDPNDTQVNIGEP
jgi:hypothetical protein